MAQGIIEQIKQKLDIVTEIGSVVVLQRAGKAYRGLCPFHGERTPSFYVFPETGTWRCFGCNEGGDIFTFVEKHQTLDFHETLTTLADKAGVNIGFTSEENHEPSQQAQARVRLREMNETAAVWFHYQLLTSATASYARSYLQARGINSESIERFRLGFAPDGVQLTQHLLAQGYNEDEVIAAGFARRRDADRGGTLYDYFRNRLIFTIRDTHEQVIAFGGRELGMGQPKYLNTPQTILFDKSSTLYGFDQARDAIRKQDQIVVVEGYVDAVIAHQYGYRNTVACIGSAITSRHVQQIKKVTRRLVLALDPDSAGEAATLRAIEVAQDGFDRIMVPVPMPAPTSMARPPVTTTEAKTRRQRTATPQGMIRFEEQVDADIRVLQLPDGVDPDEYIRQDPAAWEVALHQALPLMDFYFKTLLADLNIHTPHGQTEACRRLFPILANLGDRVKRDSYLRRLTSLLRLDERAAQQELLRYRKQRPVIATPSSDDAPPTEIGEKYYSPLGTQGVKSGVNSVIEGRLSAVRALEEHCIGLLLNNPSLLPEVCGILVLNDFWGTETRVIYSTLATLTGPYTPIQLQSTLSLLPVLIQMEAQRLRIQYEARPPTDKSQLARTAKQVALRLKRQRLSEAITEISYLQREAESLDDTDTVRSLKEQTRSLIGARNSLDAAHLVQT